MNIRLIIISILIILIIYFYLKKIKIEHATNIGLSTEAYQSVVSIFTNENVKLSNINIVKINSEDAEFSGNLTSNNLLINNNAVINGDISGNNAVFTGNITGKNSTFNKQNINQLCFTNDKCMTESMYDSLIILQNSSNTSPTPISLLTTTSTTTSSPTITPMTTFGLTNNGVFNNTGNMIGNGNMTINGNIIGNGNMSSYGLTNNGVFNNTGNMIGNGNMTINGDISGNLIGLRGMIVMWSGSIGLIPKGWALCDGSIYTFNGNNITTPDLRSRFIIGATKYDVNGSINPPLTNNLTAKSMGVTGGVEDVTLDITQIPPHNHTQTLGCDGSWCGNQNPTISTKLQTIYLNSMEAPYLNTLSSTSAGGGKSHTNMPPYYALAFIMKL
jgi:microcystin-dependent protein